MKHRRSILARIPGRGIGPLASILLMSGILFPLHPAHAASRGDDLPLVAQLIWGTDGEKPPDKNLKDVDAATRD